jgi:hypothetical protein
LLHLNPTHNHSSFFPFPARMVRSLSWFPHPEDFRVAEEQSDNPLRPSLHNANMASGVVTFHSSRSLI